MKQYRLREGDVTALDTKTQLTTAGSDTAPGPLMVPQGVTHITGVRISGIQNMAAATSFSGFVRLEGPGLVDGPQTLAANAGGNSVATGGNGNNRVTEYRLNLPVAPGNEIQIFAEMAGTDIGAYGVVVGLEFSDKANDGPASHKTITVEGDITAVDTRTALLTQGSVTTPSMIVPAGYNRIDKVAVAAASEGLADGKSTFFLRLGGNAVQGGEQLIPLGSAGRIAVQAGSDAAPQTAYAVVFENLDIVVSPSDTISVWAEMAGDDTGTARVVSTLIFATV
jgi:hypothetical protein